jgi:hypothetical protein
MGDFIKQDIILWTKEKRTNNHGMAIYADKGIANEPGYI